MRLGRLQPQGLEPATLPIRPDSSLYLVKNSLGNFCRAEIFGIAKLEDGYDDNPEISVTTKSLLNRGS